MKWVTWAEQPTKHNINNYETLPLLRIRNIRVAIMQKGRIAPIFKWKHLIGLMCIFVLMKNIFWAGPSAAVPVLWARLTTDIVQEDKTWIFLYEAANGCPQFDSKWNTENSLHFKRNLFIQFLFFFFFSFPVKITSDFRKEIKYGIHSWNNICVGWQMPCPMSGVCSGFCTPYPPGDRNKENLLKYPEGHEQMPGRSYPTVVLWLEVRSRKLNGPNDIELGNVAAVRLKVIGTVFRTVCQGFCLPRVQPTSGQTV